MKIGTLLTLEAKNPETGETHKYRSQIIEKNAHYLLIDLPIHHETNKTAFFMKGTHFKMTYIGTDQAVYMFTAKLMKMVKGDIPSLAVQAPEKEAIRIIQRRAFVRIDTAVDVAVHYTNDSFTTVTSDISGGGMSIILPEPHELNVNERTDLWMVLRMQSEHYQYVHAATEVTRIVDDNGIRKASMKYLSINQKDQQFIIRYCFEKQLEARRKELS
ncbi:flagellar brake protein [Lentibacillus salicampi]|uniref:Pilus assembly protein PilZ n=1 Tax=Lentibacillus salicampi TaxID=175306 RepID=A0A4Y9AD23_9BACI|nr:flagellar brake domain-containing protein [Lentibacillus salicampi]TFJ93798.1 pilus assembly protein PilZ [Lentibacillus salicampi]